MIREFTPEDLDGFDFNKFSNPADVKFVFKSDEWWNYTIWDGKARAIICFKDNGGDDWAGFFLISKGFKASHARELKWFFDMAIEKLNPKRLWTTSQRNKTIDRWHRYLGMSVEKTTVINGKEFKIWSKKWA